jgi:hypothetical protein
VTWDETAARAIADAAGGYPYFVQLGGCHAWEHASGQERIVGGDALHAARTIQTDADRMFRDRRARLGPTQREYLLAAAIAQLEQPGLTAVPTGEIAARLGKQHSDLTRVRSTLVNDHHLLRATSRGELEFALPRFGIWLQDQIAPQTQSGGEPVANPEFVRYVSSSHADARNAGRLNRAPQPNLPTSSRDTSSRSSDEEPRIPRRQSRRRPGRGP